MLWPAMEYNVHCMNSGRQQNAKIIRKKLDVMWAIERGMKKSTLVQGKTFSLSRFCTASWLLTAIAPEDEFAMSRKHWKRS